MKCYHATIKEKALLIIRHKVINTTSKSNTIYGIGDGIFSTSEGYVYLSLTLDKAFDFGLRAWGRGYFENKDIAREIYIFEVEFDNEAEIQIDEDEIKIEGVDNRLSKDEIISQTQSFRVSKGLRFNKEVKRYTIIQFTDTQQAYKCIDSGILLQKIKWNEVS